jgi:hypothetical protein
MDHGTDHAGYVQDEVGMLPLLLRSALSIDPDRNLLQITPYFIQSLHSQS